MATHDARSDHIGSLASGLGPCCGRRSRGGRDRRGPAQWWYGISSALRAAGLWPRSLGQVATCSGGTHDYVANLGCPKGIAAPGVDIQAGLGEDSCGFAYLPPTVRISKVTGKLTPYTWVTPVDLTEREPDEVNVAFGNLINARHRAVPDPVRLDDHDPFDLPARLFTTSQAKAYCAAPYEAFKAMRTPEDHQFNAALNELAVVFGHFVPEFITRPQGAAHL